MKKLIVFLIFFLFIFFSFLTYRNIYYSPNPQMQETVSFSVEKGQGVKEISENLKNTGLITDVFAFKAYVFLKGVSGQLKSGEYELSYNMNIPRIVNNLVMGSVKKSRITVIEGWTLDDIADSVNGIYSPDDFLKLVNSSEICDKFEFLKDKPKNLNIEGYFFPDTYEIAFDTKLKEFVEKALYNFDKKLTNELREEISQQNKSIFEIITMASIIEKEVKTLKDKKIVSGILWKRLENDMPLQVDATIAYFLHGEVDRILIEDTKIDSPYNTYKYKGLPLGPICSPGIESIEAAVYPEKSPYWFYLSAKNGTTIFSRNFEEHKNAKALYIR